MLAPGLIGQTLKQTRFAERFDAVVLAYAGAMRVYGPVRPPGCIRATLVVEGKDAALRTLARTRGFPVIGEPAYPEWRRKVASRWRSW